jgi:tRNA-dependent cyclodipeptide synthase
MNWANKNFDQIVVVVLDTVQRYNMMFNGMEANVAYQQSREAGDQWIERNKDILGDATIIRWDEITNDAGFSDALQKVHNLYDNSALVKEEIDDAIQNVAQRRNIDEAQSDFFRSLSQNYLIEEIAGTAVANRLYPGVCAYPGDLPGLWHVVNELPDAMLPEGLKTARSIKLKIGN